MSKLKIVSDEAVPGSKRDHTHIWLDGIDISAHTRKLILVMEAGEITTAKLDVIIEDVELDAELKALLERHQIGEDSYVGTTELYSAG